jgi:hypothetical protein
MGPNLLANTDLSPGAQGTGALSKLEFKSEDLDLPAFAVEAGQLQSVGRAGVEQAGEQAVDLLGAVEPVLDDPDGEGFALAEMDQIAAIGQVAEAALADASFGPPEEVYTSLSEGLPERLGGEASIGE